MVQMRLILVYWAVKRGPELNEKKSIYIFLHFWRDILKRVEENFSFTTFHIKIQKTVLKSSVLSSDWRNFSLQPCLPTTARKSKSILYHQLYNPLTIFSLGGSYTTLFPWTLRVESIWPNCKRVHKNLFMAIFTAYQPPVISPKLIDAELKISGHTNSYTTSK